MAELDIHDFEWPDAGQVAGAGDDGPVTSTPCPSTIPDGVRDGPPSPVGEDRRAGSPLAQPLCASASPREPQTAAPSAPLPDRFTPERRAQFLAALAELGSARAACARVGISAQAAYVLRRRDAVFAAGWDGALVLARRVAEDVLAQRALDGVEEPVFYRGEQVGSRWRFDGRLLLAHLARLDRHAERAPHAAGRADRFDELIAMVAGEVPAAELLPDPAVSLPEAAEQADPVLPVSCATLIDRRLATLPARASDRALMRREHGAQTDWTAWRRRARTVADRIGLPLAAPAPQAAPWTLSTVSTVSTVSTAGPGAGRAGAAPGG